MRKVTVTVGALVSASATNIATAQRPYAAGSIALIGSLSNAVATSVCASQAPAAAAFTINGTAATDGIAYLLWPSYIYITSSGDDSSRTAIIKGIDVNGTSVTETVTLTNAQSVASANAYWKVLSITPSGAIAANVTVGSYTKATLDTARRVLITTNANETSKTFTVYGTNWAGDLISEVITGVTSSTVSSVLDYLTVYRIAVSAALAGNITIGTSGVAGSPWVRFDDWAPGGTAIQCTASGTVNYTVQSTLDNPNDATNSVAPSAVTWVASSDTAVVGATSTQQSNFLFAPSYARVLLNSGSGSVTMNVLQGSNGPI